MHEQRSTKKIVGRIFGKVDVVDSCDIIRSIERFGERSYGEESEEYESLHACHYGDKKKYVVPRV